MSQTFALEPKTVRPITQVAADLGIQDDELEPYGKYKAKVGLGILDRLRTAPSGRLIYMTAMTATPAGEGKTTTAIGLTQGLSALGKKAAVCLREPSIGPVFGIKGGATGGGRASLFPMEEINLHFTGDIHAVGSAHNLLAALIDNHIFQGNALGIDPRRVLWRRVLDVNDRQLRHIIVGLGGPKQGVPREAGFDITVASEVMALLCLADGPKDLKERLGRILIGYTYDEKPVFARDLKAHGSMAALLKEALKPNLVQTSEGQPAFVHGGPFANIAHGNNSILATQTALKLVDFVVTEGGFATDLGAEKFFDLVAGYSGLKPDVAVLVCSVRSLNMHGGLSKEDAQSAGATELDALKRGMANLNHHVKVLRQFGMPIVVAINRFDTDSQEALNVIENHCRDKLGVAAAVSDVVARGGEGGIELAQAVLDVLEKEKAELKPAYQWEWSIKEKLEAVARNVYGADGVVYAPSAERDIAAITAMGYGDLPICVAKTQHSLSDDPSLKGAPTGWKLTVREVRPSLGAGFLVCLTGDVMTLPGLPKSPAAERIDLSSDGEIIGLK